MMLDRPYGDSQTLRAYAKAYIESVSPQMKAQLEKLVAGNRSDDFYRGLFSGLFNAHAIEQTVFKGNLPALIAMVATLLEKKEILP